MRSSACGVRGFCSAISWSVASVKITNAGTLSSPARSLRHSRKRSNSSSSYDAGQSAQRPRFFSAPVASGRPHSRQLATLRDEQATLATLARLIVPRAADYCVIDLFGPRGDLERAEAIHADPAKGPLLRRLRRYPPGPVSAHPTVAALRSGQPFLAPELTDADLAAVAQDDAALLGESADLLYHLTVLLRARGLSLADAVEVLRGRHGAT